MGPLREEPDRIGLNKVFEGGKLVDLGHRKRRNRIFMFSGNPEPGPARHQHGQSRAIREEFRDNRRRVGNLFKIVQHHKQRSIRQGDAQPMPQRCSGPSRTPKGPDRW